MPHGAVRARPLITSHAAQSYPSSPFPPRTPDRRCWGPSRPLPPTPPMFQYLSRRLGLDSVAFGYQQTVFGVLQLLGGPVFGRYGGVGKFGGPHPVMTHACPWEVMAWVTPSSQTSHWAPLEGWQPLRHG